MSTAKKIIIIDDDDTLRESLEEQFALHDEFTVKGVSNASDGVSTAKQEHFDLVLLDVGLPDMDGREACKLMRRNGLKAPVIMLTAQDSDADTILGLDAGANDYVSKPFRFGFSWRASGPICASMSNRKMRFSPLDLTRSARAPSLWSARIRPRSG